MPVKYVFFCPISLCVCIKTEILTINLCNVVEICVMVPHRNDWILVTWPRALTLNLKTTGEILMHSYMTPYIPWLCMLNKGGYIWPRPWSMIATVLNLHFWPKTDDSTLHYITQQFLYSGLCKKWLLGTTMVQCLDMIAGTGEFSVFDGIPTTMEPTWHYWRHCSRSCGQHRQMTGLQQWRDLTDECQDDWTMLTGGDFTVACQRCDAAGWMDIEEWCRTFAKTCWILSVHRVCDPLDTWFNATVVIKLC